MKMLNWKRVIWLIVTTSLSLYVVHSIFFGKGSTQTSLRSQRVSREGPFRGYKDCNPETDIVFHKTHKCSSSTVQNILLRYGLKHELNVVLPKSGNYLGQKSPFQANLLRGTPWQIAGLHYNLFCLHNRWNGPEVDKLMGRIKNEKPIYFTILRDPVDLFISLWDYLQLNKKYGGISLEEYALSEKTGRYQDRIGNGGFGRNQMLWDFGLDEIHFENSTVIRSKIEEIESTFELVLLTEQFDESMVLLKDLLCWDYRDMTSLKLNAQKASSKSKISTEARENLKKWMWGDYMLYDHFNEKFQQEIDAFGADKMKHELEILKHANEEIQNQCVAKQVSNEELNPEDRLHGHGVLGYTINTENKDCVFMAMKEIKFLNILRTLQTERASKISGISFEQDTDPSKFMTLGTHISLDQLKSMYKFKGP